MVLSVVTSCGSGICSSKRKRSKHNKRMTSLNALPSVLTVVSEQDVVNTNVNNNNTVVRHMLDAVDSHNAAHTASMDTVAVHNHLGNRRNMYWSLQQLNNSKRDLVEGYVVDQMYRVHSLCRFNQSDCETIRVMEDRRRRRCALKRMRSFNARDATTSYTYYTLDDTRYLSPLSKITLQSDGDESNDDVSDSNSSLDMNDIVRITSREGGAAVLSVSSESPHVANSDDYDVIRYDDVSAASLRRGDASDEQRAVELRRYRRSKAKRKLKKKRPQHKREISLCSLKTHYFS